MRETACPRHTAPNQLRLALEPRCLENPQTTAREDPQDGVYDSSRSIAALGPLFAGWLISFFGGIGTAAAMMSLIYVVGLIVTPFAGPETKGKPLPA